MPSPFPGMDPYLERPAFWPDVHHELISAIRAALVPGLRPNYVANVELRVYISDDEDPGRRVMIPDIHVHKAGARRNSNRRPASASPLLIAEPQTITLLNEEIEEAYLEIREAKSDTLVTIIEVLRPTNKLAGSSGRASFMAKRYEVMASPVHWVEIDLLRAGKPTSLNDELAESDYRIVVARGNSVPARFWPVSIRQVLPVIGVPLRGKNPDVPLNLETVLRSAYDRAGWDMNVDYTRPPDPPLSPADAKWANKLLREKGLR